MRDNLVDPARLAVVVGGLVLGFILMGGCQQAEWEGAEEDLPAVRVARLQHLDLTVEERFVGELKARREVTLEFSQAGRIASLRFDVGDRVERGTLMAEQDPAPLRAQLAEAEAALAKVRSDLARVETLYAEEMSSDEQLETARLAVKSAEAARTLAEDFWRKSRIVAPFDGVIAHRSGEEGEHYNPMNMRGPVYILVDDTEVLAVVGVPEADLGKIAVGQEAWVEVTAYPEREFPGAVSRVGAVVDPFSRAVTVEISVPNREILLKAGMTTDVRVITQEIREALVVLEEAVVSDMGLTHVFVLEGDRVVKQPVTLGPGNGGVVQVLAGLDSSSVVVVEGQYQIKEGDRVRRVSEDAIAGSSPSS